MEHAEIAATECGKTHERYAWMILLASVILSTVSALITTMPTISWLWDPVYTGAYPIMGAWSVTWMCFNLYALLIILIPFRRSERWAWYALWTLPVFWLSQFVFSPDLMGHVVLAVLSVAGLTMSVRMFFPGSKQEPSRVR